MRNNTSDGDDDDDNLQIHSDLPVNETHLLEEDKSSIYGKSFI